MIISQTPYRVSFAGGGTDLPSFYREEYGLNTLIKRYPKPYLALVDGIIMGGGVGVAVHGSHRICGERTLFAEDFSSDRVGDFPRSLYYMSGTGEVVVPFALTFSTLAWLITPPRMLPSGNFTTRDSSCPVTPSIL